MACQLKIALIQLHTEVGKPRRVIDSLCFSLATGGPTGRQL